jgi:hypothetical protein
VAVKIFKKRTLVAKEMLSTESKYVQDLHLIINGFLIPLRTQKVISQPIIWSIFGEVELVADVNAMLLAALENKMSCWSYWSTVGDIFLDHVTSLEGILAQICQGTRFEMLSGLCYKL